LFDIAAERAVGSPYVDWIYSRLWPFVSDTNLRTNEKVTRSRRWS